MPTFSYPTADFYAAELGTRQWVHARRLTPRLKEKGYTVAVTPKRQRELQAKWEASHPTDAQVLERIRCELDGQLRTPETLERIVGHLRAAGYPVRDREVCDGYDDFIVTRTGSHSRARA